MKEFIIILSVFSLFISCENKIKQTEEADLDTVSISDEKVESKIEFYSIEVRILEVIQLLPEYQESDKYIDFFK